MNIYAHRGYRAKYPENTLLAFEKALDTGCYGIELDVQLSCDGAVVIIHDESVDRTTSGSGEVKNMTLTQLKSLDAGGGQCIPTLDEYFDLVQSAPVVTNIELKNSRVDYPGLEQKVLGIVRQRGLSDRVLISSFNHPSVVRFKQMAPDTPCGFLCGHAFDVAEMAEKMRRAKVEYLHPYAGHLSDKILEELATEKVPFNVWTVNEKADALRMQRAGAAGICTDDPTMWDA